MNNFTRSYDKILKTLQSLEIRMNFLNQKRKPELSDLELIAVDLISVFLGLDSARDLFRKLPDSLSSKIERSVYNRSKRGLFSHRALLRNKIAQRIGKQDYLIIDSMPLEVCKLSRSTCSSISKERYETAPNRGYCASRNSHYYGYKLHAVCTTSSIFTSFDLTQTSVHDIHYLNDIKTSYSDCTILGDKGYLSLDYQLDLFETKNIKLEVPMIVNQSNYHPQRNSYRKARKRIETLFSQLCDQFMIRRNWAKTFDGFKNRILSKIMALTVIQLINKQRHRNINNFKTCIV